jgi:predicted metal-binding membrane protein
VTSAQRDRLTIGAPLAIASLAAWALIIMCPFGMALPAFCSSHDGWTITALLQAWRAAPGMLDLITALNPPVGLAVAWLLMLVAMMSPLLAEPLLHIRARSFRSRRARSIALFVSAYLAIWCLAGVLLITTAFAAQLSLGGLALPAVLLAAIVWQFSPAKQFCLNRCHRTPALSAFGAAADRDLLRYASLQAVWCIGTCWKSMMLPLLIGRGHLIAMLLGALWAFAERYERPGPLVWKLRWPRKLARAGQELRHKIMRLPGAASS